MLSVTQHHNIPQSQGGSDHPINLTDLPGHRHDGFHEWADNRIPCHLSRLILLHSIGGENVPDFETVETLFQITTVHDWTRLYCADAFRPVSEPGGIRRARKTAGYQMTHCLEELVAIRKTIEAITNGGTFPAKESNILKKCLRFFRTESATAAVELLHTETNDAGDLSWVKCMQSCTRRSVVDAMKHADEISNDRRTLKKFRPILHTQERYMKEHHDMWESVLRKDGRWKKKH